MLQRYGLENNPFEFSEAPLTPGSSPGYVAVEGFADRKADIDNWAANPINSSHLFLIYGESGMGRTSVLNYIESKFKENQLQHNKKDKLLTIVQRVVNDHEIEPLHGWMETFSSRARRTGFRKIRDYFRTMMDEKEGEFPSVVQYRDFLYDALTELDGKDTRLVVIFEDVRNSGMFVHLREIFANTNDSLPYSPLVLLETNRIGIYDDFEALHPKPDEFDSIKLRELRGQEVWELISQRWQEAQLPSAKENQQAFDEDGVKIVFDLKPYPFKQVVQVLKYILTKKLQTLQPEGNLSDEQFKMDARQITDFLMEWEDNNLRSLP
jgi:hypothetical protein